MNDLIVLFLGSTFGILVMGFLSRNSYEQGKKDALIEVNEALMKRATWRKRV